VKLSAELKAFQQRLGYEFQTPKLLSEAVTHASMSTPNRDDNQRLEFLGDRVLGLVMACADVAREIDIGAVLRLGRSEMLSGGRRKQALLGDAMEAVIAAVYIDGGFDAARALILRLWGARTTSVKEDARDAKTSLQEWAQARGLEPPAYVLMDRSGPDHAPIFTIAAKLSTGETASATAGAKRAAEQDAATKLLAQLEQNT